MITMSFGSHFSLPKMVMNTVRLMALPGQNTGKTVLITRYRPN
jgi:hypothetical protein